MPDTATLYDTDWYAWTQDQAARLRELPPSQRPNGLDVEHLAEEVEDMGRSERKAAMSLMRNIATHLLKLEFHPDQQPRRHWQREVATWRADLELDFKASPSLRARREELFVDVWPQAWRVLNDSDGLDSPELLRCIAEAGVSAEVPYFDVDAQLLASGWYPPPRA
ncbi:DUF29 domain-containing protein [Falsiroseomonas bella]|nr:DUF29 domain-containing protein [Falsiroseomonas bella]